MVSGVENFDIYYGHVVYFTAILCFCIFVNEYQHSNNPNQVI
jgi:hypothetical protein